MDKLASRAGHQVVAMADGFLGRWSQRKQAVQQGRVVDEPAPVSLANAEANSPAATPVLGAPPGSMGAIPQVHDAPAERPAPPVPTLDDVKALNADSSYAPFVARDVAPEVRNAAMKKLFSDPHYNLMDGLDIYIDDYSKPDPMPANMLRQLASAKFLNLFEEEEPAKTAAGAKPRLDLADVHPATVASDPLGEPVPVLLDTPAAPQPDTLPNTLSAPLAADLPAQDSHHDHTDLRLQPNDAAGRSQSERSPE